MATKTKETAFKGIKKQLKNTTVRKYIPSGESKERYMIFKGKGTGSQIASTNNFEEVLFFDECLDKVVYKTIFSKKDGSKGGAYFFKDEMVFSDHPFKSEGYTFDKK